KITAKDRPYIGRKGIGKLALLSCAKRISIQTKQAGGEYIGGVIDNSELDLAINSDLTPDEYQLEGVSNSLFNKFEVGHKSGTIIYFEDVKDGIKRSAEFLRKLIALYFRFSLLDSGFNIFVDEKKVTLDDLDEL